MPPPDIYQSFCVRSIKAINQTDGVPVLLAVGPDGWTESPCVNFRSYGYGNTHDRIGDDPFAISDKYLRTIRVRRT